MALISGSDATFSSQEETIVVETVFKYSVASMRISTHFQNTNQLFPTNLKSKNRDNLYSSFPDSLTMKNLNKYKVSLQQLGTLRKVQFARTIRATQEPVEKVRSATKTRVF